MALIYYSMAGEGRGHATRARSLVEELLKEGHDVRLFCPGDAYDLLAPVYAESSVRVDRIPGLVFHYNRQKKLDPVRTALGAFGYAVRMPALIGRLEKLFRIDHPDLVVTDFEPSLPRTAKRVGIPFLSINHQHFLLANDLRSLPWRLQVHAWFMAQVVRRYYSGQAATVISQFYFPPLKRNWEGRAVQAGVLMRPEILNCEPVIGNHIVVYLRKFASENLMRALKACGREVRLYGLGKLDHHDNICYCEIDDRRFLEDLASSQALISTAGNQLVGEALYLGKPVFAMPEPGNQEQHINAHYLAESGAGEWTELEFVTPAQLRRFLNSLDSYRHRIDPARMNGNSVAMKVINDFLEGRVQICDTAERHAPGVSRQVPAP